MNKHSITLCTMIAYLLSHSLLAHTQQTTHGTNTQWSYVGIPYTDWSYDPFTVTPTRPAEWPAAAANQYYYVEPDHPAASDQSLAGEPVGDFGRFGYPDRPRATIPSDGWIGDQYSSGTVIWLKGGTYTAQNFYGEWSPQFHGTNSQPVFVYGDPNDKPIFSGPRISLYNSSYLIMDNLEWIGNNAQNGVLRLTRDRPGPTHHVVLKNLRFENLDYVAGGGAIVGLNSSGSSGAELHDVVAYKNVFKNNGGGYDWSTVDNDHHGYKVNGTLGGNGAYRIWIIDNTALAGDQPDPVDGLFKSLSGNLIQVGDQVASSGNNHHVFAAGNYQEYGRQALGWTKKSSDVIFSGNHCTNTYSLAGGNGQCYGHQYSLGDYNWWINNVGTQSSSGWMHTANDPMTGPLFIIGNLFYNNKNSEANDNWRLCSGITLFTQQGIHYIVNNVFDNSCHGIWARNNRHGNADQMYIYNNIFSNISGTIDTTSKAISLEDSNGIQLFAGHNLFATFNDAVSLNTTTYASVDVFNQQSWASQNLAGDPAFIDTAAGNYNINESSAAINMGTQSYANAAPDVYQQFIDRYDNDPNYPGDPRNYWPQDYLERPRVRGVIDMGPFEFHPLVDLIFKNDFE